MHEEDPEKQVANKAAQELMPEAEKAKAEARTEYDTVGSNDKQEQRFQE
jgi:hypothetical protein